MPGLIMESALREWTAGLPLQEQLISIYYHIRDIPYALVSVPAHQDSGPGHLLITGRGSCGPKHHLLGAMFMELGIPVRYRTWPFLWNDPALLYPPELRASAKRLDLSSHLACQAFLQGTWILVDATWDLPLEKAGFPVNHTWDGRSDTLLAVHPVSIDEYQRWRDNQTSDRSKKGNVDGREFFDLFNDWLEQVRHQT